ncbi:hypothetical protein BJ166DRAFT_606517 [Pestalotiopsis sp. NC0098]|nr:hypothetical protein BJ166DRAFT_606517 [Pestalotiopsis sp. NC0098]
MLHSPDDSTDMAGRRKEPERGMKESLLIDGALNDESTPNYMPTSLRMPFLCCMAVYLCALIAMLEFGFHKLPLSQDGDHTSRNDFIGPFVSGPLVAVRHPIKPTPQTSVATSSNLRQDLRAPPAVRGFQKYPRWPLNTTTKSAILSPSLTQPVPTQTPIPDTNFNDTISFGNRTFIFSHLPPNETRLANSGTLRRGIKEPDPGNYADFASRRRIGIMFHLLWRGHTVTGQSFISYCSTDDDDCIQNMGVYEGACAGSALVFFDPMGWQALKYQAQREKECRESLTGYDWMAVETELTASKCLGAEVLAIIDGVQPTTGGSSSQVTSITAEVFVVTDENGYGVSSTARLLPTFVTSNTVETFRDSQGRPTRTFVHAVELEQTIVTLQDDSGQPTTTFTTGVPRDAAFETLTDSNGIPTATIEILTLRDPFGLPTATEKYELDSNGSPTAWHELILATLRDSQGDATATAMFEVQELYDDKGVPTATVEVQLDTLRDPQGQPTTTLDNDGHPQFGPGPVTLTDSNGVATATAIGYSKYTEAAPPTGTRPTPSACPESKDSSGCVKIALLHPITQSEYVSGYFLPILRGLVASVLAQFISSDLQTLLPFRALTRPGGAEAADSICLDTGGLQGPITSWTLLRRFKDPVSFLSNFLLYASNMVVALSSEAFGTPFERFMDNQSFGVRLLFTSLGLIISFFWQYQFSCRAYAFSIAITNGHKVSGLTRESEICVRNSLLPGRLKDTVRLPGRLDPDAKRLE